jgi:orotidine-5'-phosphate decarboxylase
MRDRLIVALDVPDMESALAMREKIGSEAGWLKVGLRLFVAEGPSLVKRLAEEHKIFLDLKFHDIPNTVAEAVESAGKLGVQMLNVHAGGGPDMLKRASEAALDFPDMKLIAVTVLTSDPMPAGDAMRVALERARMTQDAGLDGVVCSVHEAAAIKDACGAGFITVTPGIRWGDQDAQDQKRIADPGHAIESGSDYLVVGRPVLQAVEPALVAREVVEMMEAARQ